jgi:hypothetical protein
MERRHFKRYFLLSLLLFGIHYVSFSQAFKAGISAGLSTSQVGGDGYGGFNKAGLTGGVFINTSLNEKMDGQFELEYVQKGSRKNPDTEKGDTEFFLLRLDYVQIPMLLKYYHKNFFLEGGLYVGVLVNFHIENESGVVTDLFKSVQKEQVKSLDQGMLIGLGYRINQQFLFTTRLQQTVGNVKRHESGQQRYLDSGWTNTVVAFTFRYEFGQTS